MAEFAIVFPIQLLLMLGIMQLSMILVAKLVVNYAAFAAARSRSVNHDPTFAATLVCSPITGATCEGGVTFDPEDVIQLPGWGIINKSAISRRKTTVYDYDFSVGSWSKLNNAGIDIESEVHFPDIGELTGGQSDFVVIVVAHEFELIFPLVNELAAFLVSEEGTDRWGAPHLTLSEYCIMYRAWVETTSS